jgi:hypothetical protein
MEKNSDGIWMTIAKGIGLVGTIVTIGLVSIGIADGYRAIKDELVDLRLSKLVDAQRTTIESLNETVAQMNKTVAAKSSECDKLKSEHASSIAASEDRIKELEGRLQVQDLSARATKEQDAYNAELLTMYAEMIRTIEIMNKSPLRSLSTSPASPEIAHVNKLMEHRKEFAISMEAKGLAKTIIAKGGTCLVLTAYPDYGVDEKTGALVPLETKNK